MAVFPAGASIYSSRDGIFCLLRQSPLQFEQHQLSLWDCRLFLHLQYPARIEFDNFNSFCRRHKLRDTTDPDIFHRSPFEPLRVPDLQQFSCPYGLSL